MTISVCSHMYINSLSVISDSIIPCVNLRNCILKNLKLLFFVFSRAVCSLSGNIFPVEISCGRHADDMQMMCG